MKKVSKTPVNRARNSSGSCASNLTPEPAKAPLESIYSVSCDSRTLFAEAQRQEISRLTQIQAPPYILPRLLADEEWYLGKCSKGELEMCLMYELSREVPLWRQMVLNYRLIDKGNRPTAILNFMQFFSHLVWLDRFPDWPAEPWQLSKHRVNKNNPMDKWRALFADLDALRADAPPPTRNTTLTTKNGGTYLHSYLHIDLRESPTSIKLQFAKWLKYWTKNRVRLQLKPEVRRPLQNDCNGSESID